MGTEGIVGVARADTPDGEVALRRRDGVLELIVNGAFAMDSLEVSTEVRLASEALARHTAPGRVLIGGLGLGFTTRAVLADSRVGFVEVVERAAPLVHWARAGLVPELAGLEGERCRLLVGDIGEVLLGCAGSAGGWDLVLLDVDNGPGFLIHEGNARLYGVPLLRAARDRLEPGGQLVIWSSHVAPDLLVALQAAGACPQEAAEEIIEVTRQGRLLRYALYRLTAIWSRN